VPHNVQVPGRAKPDENRQPLQAEQCFDGDFFSSFSTAQGHVFMLKVGIKFTNYALALLSTSSRLSDHYNYSVYWQCFADCKT
jgi:hypothetical protein